MKILVIGLDGATFDIITPLIKKGKLPTIAKLMNEGVYGELESIDPPVSPSAWASFATGMNPGKHGIFGFSSAKGGIAVIDSAKMGVFPLWETLSMHNKRVCVLSVPFTYPPREVNGIMATGMGTPGTKSEFAFPRGMKKDLIKMGYKPEFDRKCLDHEELFDRELWGAAEGVRKTSKYFIKNFDRDFFMVVFGEPDTVQHIFWKYLDKKHPHYDERNAERYGNKIYQYYQKLDKIISELVEMIDDDTYIIIMSDHGGGPVYKRIALNNWLKKEGFLKLKNNIKIKQKQSFFAVRYLSIITRLIGKNHIKIINMFGLDKYLSRVSILLNVHKRLFPEKHHDPLQDVDWEQTTAYSKNSYGQIYINIDKKGRQYENIRKEIIKKLYDFVDPESGEKVVSKVFRKEDLFSGPFVDSAPDIYGTTKPGYEIIESITGGPIFIPPFRSGTHTKNGIFICNGPDIKGGCKINGVKITDLAPTILDICETPIPKDVDGRVLKEIFEEDSNLFKRDIVYQDEKEEIKNKLRRLKKIGKI